MDTSKFFSRKRGISIEGVFLIREQKADWILRTADDFIDKGERHYWKQDFLNTNEIGWKIEQGT